MRVDPADSVFLVTSSDPDNQQFGTAFAFYSGEDANGHTEAIYFLTCRHVITDVGGPDRVRAGGFPVKVVAEGSEDGLDDLAVLRVEDLRNVPILRLNPSAEAGNSVKVLGFRSFARSMQIIRPLQAQLGERVGLETRRKPGRVLAWDLKIEGDYDLEQGYSGGPIIEEESGDVIGIANYRLGGRKGVVLSIEILERFRPAIIEEIRASVVGQFWRNLLARLPEPVESIDASILDQPGDFSRSHVLGVGTRSNRICAMVEADGLDKMGISALLGKLYKNTQRLGFASVSSPGGGRRRLNRLDVFFLFLNGCPQDTVHVVTQQAELARDSLRDTLRIERRTLVVIRVYFWVFDLKEGQTYIAPKDSTTSSLHEYYQALVEKFRHQYLYQYPL